MGIFGINKIQSAGNRLANEAFYAIALREIESGLRRDGLWAQALSECDMDHTKAAARYIQLRVQSMKDEKTLHSEQEAIAKSLQSQNEFDEEQKRIIAAEIDLPRHPICGGIIDRTQQGTSIQWKCRKCRKTGKFSIARM